jgi:hypothetical protein
MQRRASKTGSRPVAGTRPLRGRSEVRVGGCHTLYTVGYAGFTIEAFVRLLKSAGSGTVCDVRSAPYSRHYPAFSARALRARLAIEGLDYLFLGRELGARRAEEEAYTGDRVDYEKVRRLETFRLGLRRIHGQLQVGPVTLMCAEKDPIRCHRLLLVVHAFRHDGLRGQGRLSEPASPGARVPGRRTERSQAVWAGLRVLHLRSDGQIETQEDVERRLLELHGAGQGELFPSGEDPLERAYRLQGEAIAFVRRSFPGGPSTPGDGDSGEPRLSAPR